MSDTVIHPLETSFDLFPFPLPVRSHSLFLFFFLAADVSDGLQNDVLMERPHWVQLISLGVFGM